MKKKIVGVELESDPIEVISSEVLMEELEDEGTVLPPIDSLVAYVSEEKIDLGKFNTEEDLITAYKNLEVAFTKKSQELSELKKSVEDVGVAPESDPQPTDEQIKNLVYSNTALRDEIIKIYFTEGMNKRSPVLLNSNVKKSAPPEYAAPSSLNEAKEEVRKMFGNN